MKVLFILIFCFGVCLMAGCYGARGGAQQQTSVSAASNSMASVKLSTGKVDRVTELLQQIRGNKDVTGLVDKFVAMGQPAFPGLIKLLKDGTKTERANVMYILARMKTYPAEAVPIIEKMLDEKGADRVHIAIDLQKIEPDSIKARNVLAEEIKKGDSSTRIIIVRTLSLNPNADKSLPVLLDTITDSDADVRMAVAQTLGEIGMKNKEAGAMMLPALIKALDDSSTDVCIQSARALGLIGEPAKSAVPALLKMQAEDKRDKVKKAASKALALINTEQRRAGRDGKSQKKSIKDLL